MSGQYFGGSPGTPNTLRSGATGLTQRRSSYASVAAGTASQASQPVRSGAFTHLLNDTNDSYDPSHSSTYLHNRLDTGGMSQNGRESGRDTSYYGHSGQLPSFSSAFGMFTNGHSHAGLGSPLGDEMFVPSYLKRSKHVRNLQESQRARAKARRNAPPSATLQSGSLSTSANSASIYGKSPISYRGITSELIERAPPADDESLAPLPSRWNALDKNGGLDVLSEGQEVKFTGPKPGGDRDHEACSIRADHYMPPQCGIYYYEVTILSRKREEYDTSYQTA